MSTSKNPQVKVVDDISLSLNEICEMSTEVLSRPDELLEFCFNLNGLIAEYLALGGHGKVATESLFLLGGLIKYANSLNSKLIAFDKEHSK
ncbi:MAG: hypothetical protein ACRDD9_04190 [Shewanella sp.]